MPLYNYGKLGMEFEPLSTFECPFNKTLHWSPPIEIPTSEGPCHDFKFFTNRSWSHRKIEHMAFLIICPLLWWGQLIRSKILETHLRGGSLF